MLRGEAANINIIVLGLTDAPRSTTREQTNHYITDVVHLISVNDLYWSIIRSLFGMVEV